MASARVQIALREAVVTLSAAIATLLCARTIAPGLGPAVLAVVLCISLARSGLYRARRDRIEAAIALPIVGWAAAGVGMLLHRTPWFGALIFVAAMFLSVWLRQFGSMARRAATLITLPFVVLLTTPYIPATSQGLVPAVLVPAVIAVLALLWVTVLYAIARRLRFLPNTPESRSAAPAPMTVSSLRPGATTRMAIQMAVALAAAFVIGYVHFAERWAWIVLTAFIVISGNRGRLDVVYKSVLRILGAAAGTILALSIGKPAGYHDTTTTALILGAVFLAVWLRPLNYAWWALFVTLALALLQVFAGAPAPRILWPRVEEIAIGAVVGIASAWFVLPVRSTNALRRRIADALTTLSDALDPATLERTPGGFVAAVARVEEMAPAFRASRLVTRRFRNLQPADWVDALAACRDPAIARIESRETSDSVHRAVGAARRSMRQPDEILPALRALSTALRVFDPAGRPS
jgi:Fusaric acid resistance protein-like